MGGMGRESWGRLCLENNTHADRDTKSLIPSSSSVFTPGKWPLVPISFSSKVKGSGSNYLQLNFHYPQDRWRRGVLPFW